MPSPSEAARLNALARYDVLDTPPEAFFDRLTRLGARFFGVPIALVSFVDKERQWFKSCFGADLTQTSREVSFCAHALEHRDVLVVEDATQDARFAQNPLVTGEMGIRFYAGAPLRTPDGYVLGTLCLIARAPRSFSAEEQATLQDFAAMAMDELELRREVAARRRTEERLRLIEAAVAHAEDAIVITEVDPEGRGGWRVHYVNDTFRRDTGYAAEEIVGQTALPLDGPDTDPATAAAIRDAIEAGEPIRTDMRCYRKDGSSFWCDVHIVPVRDASGAVTHWASIARDISERRAAQEALRRNEAKYRSVVEGIRDAVLQTDTEGRWTFLSPAWETITGFTVEQSLGRSLFEFIHPEEHRRHEALFAPLIEGTAAFVRFQTRYLTKSGDFRHVEVHAQILRDEAGAVTGTSGTLSDITDSVRFEAEREARRRAEELLQVKTSFLNNMSHELRTPLTAILGFAEVLAEEATGVHHEFAQRIVQSGRRLQNTLGSVMDLAKLDSGEIRLNPEDTNVAAEVREAVQTLAPLTRRESLALDVVAPPEVRACVDRPGLGRILNNLIGNALKFTDEGRVTVTVCAEEECADEERAEAERVRLRVEDTGIGISEAFLEHLFDEFRQESTGLSRAYEGSGLGLSITKRLVDLMGGTLSVESTEGVGTAFTLSLPRHAAPAEDAARASDTPQEAPEHAAQRA